MTYREFLARREALLTDAIYGAHGILHAPNMRAEDRVATAAEILDKCLAQTLELAREVNDAHEDDAPLIS